MIGKHGDLIIGSDSLKTLLPSRGDGELAWYFKETYPPELLLKRENLSNNEGSLLDLLTKRKNNQLSIQLCDTRDDFSVPFVKMSSLKSNTPLKIFYSTYESEILRKDSHFPTYFFKQI